MSSKHHVRSLSLPPEPLGLHSAVRCGAVKSSCDMRHDAARCDPKRNWCQKSEATLNSRENCNLCSTVGMEELDKALFMN